MDAQKKRLLIIVLFGLAAIGAVFLLTDPAMSPLVTPASPGPSAAVSPAPPVVAPGSPINNKTPVMPEGAQLAGLPARDIFAPPAEYARMLPQEPRAGAAGGNRVSQAAGPMPVLTGIIIGDSTRVAILRQGTISRSHRVGESAGAYRIASIGTDSVTLTGPIGTVELKMGQ